MLSPSRRYLFSLLRRPAPASSAALSSSAAIRTGGRREEGEESAVPPSRRHRPQTTTASPSLLESFHAAQTLSRRLHRHTAARLHTAAAAHAPSVEALLTDLEAAMMRREASQVVAVLLQLLHGPSSPSCRRHACAFENGLPREALPFFTALFAEEAHHHHRSDGGAQSVPTLQLLAAACVAAVVPLPFAPVWVQQAMQPEAATAASDGASTFLSSETEGEGGKKNKKKKHNHQQQRDGGGVQHAAELQDKRRVVAHLLLRLTVLQKEYRRHWLRDNTDTMPSFYLTSSMLCVAPSAATAVTLAQAALPQLAVVATSLRAFCWLHATSTSTAAAAAPPAAPQEATPEHLWLRLWATAGELSSPPLLALAAEDIPGKGASAERTACVSWAVHCLLVTRQHHTLEQLLCPPLPPPTSSTGDGATTTTTTAAAAAAALLMCLNDATRKELLLRFLSPFPEAEAETGSGAAAAAAAQVAVGDVLVEDWVARARTFFEHLRQHTATEQQRQERDTQLTTTTTAAAPHAVAAVQPAAHYDKDWVQWLVRQSKIPLPTFTTHVRVSAFMLANLHRRLVDAMAAATPPQPAAVLALLTDVNMLLCVSNIDALAASLVPPAAPLVEVMLAQHDSWRAAHLRSFAAALQQLLEAVVRQLPAAVAAGPLSAAPQRAAIITMGDAVIRNGVSVLDALLSLCSERQEELQARDRVRQQQQQQQAGRGKRYGGGIVEPAWRRTLRERRLQSLREQQQADGATAEAAARLEQRLHHYIQHQDGAAAEGTGEDFLEGYVRRHKYQLLLTELPHEVLAGVVRSVLAAGYVEEGGALGGGLVARRQLHLAHYQLPLLGSLYQAAACLHQQAQARQGEGRPQPYERVMGRLRRLYKRREEVFGEHMAPVPEAEVAAVSGKRYWNTFLAPSTAAPQSAASAPSPEVTAGATHHHHHHNNNAASDNAVAVRQADLLELAAAYTGGRRRGRQQREMVALFHCLLNKSYTTPQGTYMVDYADAAVADTQHPHERLFQGWQRKGSTEAEAQVLTHQHGSH